MSQELKSLEAKKSEVTGLIELSTQTLTFATDHIERARQMIEKANNILVKAELVRDVETAKQMLMTARSIQVPKLEAKKHYVLEKIQARLVEVAIIGREELRPQATIRAEENKKQVVYY